MSCDEDAMSVFSSWFEELERVRVSLLRAESCLIESCELMLPMYLDLI